MSAGDSEPQLSPRLGQRIPAPLHNVSFRFEEATDLTEEDERALIELLRTAFNGGPGWFGLTPDPVDHLRWKFRDFPGTAQAELLEDGGRIVGMIFGMRRRFLVRGHELIGRDAVDLALDPSIQGRGIQTLRSVDMLPVRKQMFPDVTFNWNLATHPTARHLAGRQGTLPVANYLETHLKPLSIRKLFNRVRPGDQTEGTSRTREMLEAGDGRFESLARKARLGLRLAVASARIGIARQASGDIELTTLTSFDDSANKFWEKAAAAFDFIQIRDADYLNWRFCDARGGAYVVRAATDDGKLLGYAAMRIDGQQAILGDLLALPGRTDIVRALLADATDLARSHGVPIMRAWLPHSHPYRAVLKKSGFVSSPTDLSLGYQQWREDAAELAFLEDPAAKVHMMIADADHI